MDNAELWDIFYRPQDPAGMWFGFQLARTLAEHRQRVRLYCDDIKALSVAHVNLDPHVFVQNLGHVEILDSRLARSISAAHNLVEVFDATPPAPYMARYFSQAGSGSWFTLLAPWGSTRQSTAIQVRNKSQIHRQFDVQLGDTPNSAGLIRSTSPFQVQRSAPASMQAARASILSLLGLSTSILECQRTAFVGAGSAIAWPHWIRQLIESDVTHCLFIEHGDLQEKLAPIFSRPPGQPGTSSIGALTVVFLPPLLWALVDEIIGVADFIVTDRDDVAFRAAERGTPVLRAQPAAGKADIGHWLCEGASPLLKDCYRGAASALSDGFQVAENVGHFLARLDEFQRHAAQLQKRISRAAEVIALLLTSSEIATAAHVERLFAPTQPNESL